MSVSEEVKDFCQSVSYNDENLFVRKLRSGGLSDEQIAIVIKAIESTCRKCWDGESGCKCWKDE